MYGTFIRLYERKSWFKEDLKYSSLNEGGNLK